MSNKLYFFLFFILFSTISEISSEEEEEFTTNPYIIFKLPPWTKFEDIKKKYENFKEKAIASNRTHTQKYKLMRKAYDKIYDEYKNNNYKDETFFSILIKTIKNIFTYEFIVLFLLFITWFVYKFNTYAAYLVGAFVAIDNIIPHWFGTMLTQYIVSFILGTVLYFRSYFCSFICDKKNKQKGNNNNPNHSSSNNSGNRLNRKRFEKIEI